MCVTFNSNTTYSYYITELLRTQQYNKIIYCIISHEAEIGKEEEYYENY